MYVQLIRFLKNNISLFYALTQPLGKTSLIGQSSFSRKNLETLFRKKIKLMTPLQVRTRAPMSEICTRLGQTDHSEQDWLVLSKVKPPPPHKEFFPRPPKRTDGSYVYDRIPSLAPEPVPASRHQMLYKKRPYEEKPVDTPSSKPVRTGTQTRTYSVNQVAPKGKFATMARVSGGQKTVISWQDAPDDLFYRASKEIKKVG